MLERTMRRRRTRKQTHCHCGCYRYSSAPLEATRRKVVPVHLSAATCHHTVSPSCECYHDLLRILPSLTRMHDGLFAALHP